MNTNLNSGQPIPVLTSLPAAASAQTATTASEQTSMDASMDTTILPIKTSGDGIISKYVNFVNNFVPESVRRVSGNNFFPVALPALGVSLVTTLSVIRKRKKNSKNNMVENVMETLTGGLDFGKTRRKTRRKSVRKSARKSARKSVRKSVRKTHRKSVRKTHRRIRRKSRS
jgi:hypothetical protein